MERSRTASDKVRPFLEAMERTIDQARRKRTGESTASTPAASISSGNGSSIPSAPTPQYIPPSAAPASAPATPAPSQPQDSASPTAHDIPVSNEETPDAPPARLKARPKRPSGFGSSSNYNQDNLSQAG